MFIYNTFILSQKLELLIPWGFPAFYPYSTVENGIIKQRTTNIKLFRHFFWLFWLFYCFFLLNFFAELFLLTEVISQPQENLTWKREFHLSYKLLADFTCWFFCFIELNLFLNSYPELSIFRNLLLRIFTDSLFTAYIFPTNHFHPFNRHITQPVFRLSLSSQPFISALRPSPSSQPSIPAFHLSPSSQPFPPVFPPYIPLSSSAPSSTLPHIV